MTSALLVLLYVIHIGVTCFSTSNSAANAFVPKTGSLTSYYMIGPRLIPQVVGSSCGTTSPGVRSATETVVQWVALKGSGTARDLACWVDTAMGGGSVTFALRQNEGATTLTCTMTGSGTKSCTDASNTVAISAGDRLSIQSVTGSTPPANASASGSCWFNLVY